MKKNLLLSKQVEILPSTYKTPRSVGRGGDGGGRLEAISFLNPRSMK
jgi:hypothetical protein